MSLPYRFEGRRQTARLALRSLTDGDLDALARMHGDQGVARWLYWDARDRDEVRAVLEHKRTHTVLAANGDALSFAIELADGTEVVGDGVLILPSADHLQGEIGYIVDPRHQGCGYATEAALALLAIAFDEVGLHRVVGRAEARNVASSRVLERAGMRREAHLIENEFVKGEWQSEVVYALLRSEWEVRRST